MHFWVLIVHYPWIQVTLKTLSFSNPPPLFLFSAGSSSATLCQGLIQLWWQRTWRSQVQQGWHHHPAPAGGWKLVPWRDGRSPWIFPHQLCPGHQTSPTATPSMQGPLWLWAERQGGWQGLLAIFKGAENLLTVQSLTFIFALCHTHLLPFTSSKTNSNTSPLVNALGVFKPFFRFTPRSLFLLCMEKEA